MLGFAYPPLALNVNQRATTNDRTPPFAAPHSESAVRFVRCRTDAARSGEDDIYGGVKRHTNHPIIDFNYSKE